MDYRGNLAYRPAYQSSPYVAEKRALGNAHRNVAKGKLLKVFVWVAVLAAVAFLLVGREVYISELNNRANSLTKELTALETQNKQTRVRLEQSVDLNNVEKVATEKFGMARAEKHQMVYVNLAKADVVTTTNKTSLTDEIKKALGTGVKNLFGIFGAQ